MEFTGERVVPGQTDPDLLNEHLARYAFAEALVRSKRVLDAGCGVGYGSARLAKEASQVFAIDNAQEALRIGRRDHAHPRVQFLQADCGRLPFASASLDVVVAFEVIEHLEDWPSLLEEARRVLAPSGQLLVSTPNRLYYAESRETPNPFHLHEFDYEEFRAELEKRFPYTTIFLENHTNAITFTPLKIQGVRTALEQAAGSELQEAHFFLAVCSQQPLYGSPAFVYVPESGNVLRAREHHIDLLEDELAKKTRWLEDTIRELKELSEQNQAEQKRAQEAIDELQAENERKTEWAQQVEERLEERTRWSLQLDAENKQLLENYRTLEATTTQTQAELAECVRLLDDAEQRVIERTEWAQRLDRELEAARAELATLYGSPAYRLGRRLRLAPEPPQRPTGTAPPAKEQPSQQQD